MKMLNAETRMRFPEALLESIQNRVRELGLTEGVSEENCRRWWVAVCSWLVVLARNVDRIQEVNLDKTDSAPYELVITRIFGFRDKMFWLLSTFYQFDLKSHPEGYRPILRNIKESPLVPQSIRDVLLSENGELGQEGLCFLRRVRNHLTPLLSGSNYRSHN